MSTFRIAWRNLWRNRRRTMITVVAVALNTAILIATLALMEGMRLQMVRSATRLLVGDVQVHDAEFRADRSMYSSIENPDAVLTAAREHGALAAPRSYGFGLLSAGTKSAGAMFVGVDPAAEQAAFELAREILAGAYLAAKPEAGVVLGRKLAKSLNAELGTELVAVVQGADGSLGNELFHVVGVLKTVGEEIDRGALFMHRSDFDTLFVAGGRVHEIALSGQGQDPVVLAAAVASTLGVTLVEDGGKPVLAVESWHELMPMVSDMVNMFSAMVALFGFVFFLGAGLGVLNTMLMATHDRVREFGVLKALGATPGRIVRDVATEGFVLALISTLLGFGIGAAASAYFYYVGIDLSSFGAFGFSGIAWDPIWRGHLTVNHVISAMVAMWAACVIASLYPGVKASRLDPARAMTHV